MIFLPLVRIEGRMLLSSMPSARHSKRGIIKWSVGRRVPRTHHQVVPAVTHPDDRTCKRTAGPSSSRRTCPVKTRRDPRLDSVSAGSCATARSAGKNHLVRANRGERRRDPVPAFRGGQMRSWSRARWLMVIVLLAIIVIAVILIVVYAGGSGGGGY
jgi:hypothetical protein